MAVWYRISGGILMVNKNDIKELIKSVILLVKCICIFLLVGAATAGVIAGRINLPESIIIGMLFIIAIRYPESGD